MWHIARYELKFYLRSWRLYITLALFIAVPLVVTWQAGFWEQLKSARTVVLTITWCSYFLIADGVQGDFELEIAAIASY